MALDFRRFRRKPGRKTGCGYAKSGRTSCKICNKKFDKGEFRLSYTRSCRPTLWYHPQCFIYSGQPFNDRLGHGITGYKTTDFYGFENLKPSDQDLLRNILPLYLKQKAELKLEKHLFEMDINELKTELKKRKMKIQGKRYELEQRLREYLQNDWCITHQKLVDAKLVHGFCREFQKHEKMNVPIPLIQMINKYFPTKMIL